MTFVFFYLTVFIICLFTYLLNPFIEKKTFTLNKNANELVRLFFFLSKIILCGVVAILWFAPVPELVKLFNEGRSYSQIDNGIIGFLSIALSFLITSIIALPLGVLFGIPLVKYERKFDLFNESGKLIKIRPFASGFIIFVYGISIFIGHWWFLPDKSAVCHRYLDGRYSYKTAADHLVSLRERVGSEFGIIDNCNKYIRLVDPDKLIINKEGFWDTFYSDK